MPLPPWRALDRLTCYELFKFQWSKVLNCVPPGLHVQGTFRRCAQISCASGQLEKVPQSGATIGAFLVAPRIAQAHIPEKS
eukprot:351487-Chlamydomonas_euryale.AAC.14